MWLPVVENMHEAKTHLSRLVERVEGGEEIIIGRAGMLVPRARIEGLVIVTTDRRLARYEVETVTAA